MKVRADSWHYRLWRFGRESSSQPRDLCRYFWHLALIKVALPAAVASLTLFAIGTLVVLIWGHPIVAGLAVLGALLVIAIVIGLVLLIRRLVERHDVKRRERRRNPQPVVEREPSILWQYLKARKRKLCPLIEVVNNRGGSQ